MKYSRRTLLSVYLPLISSGHLLVSAQAFTAQAQIAVSSAGVSLEMNNPRPLLQGLVALKELYGLPIDYEDPIYTGDEIRDDSGIKLVAGRTFRAFIPLLLHNTQEQRGSLLRSLVGTYNISGYPGRFVVQQDGKRWDITGIGRTKTGVLDTRISVPEQKRSVNNVIDVVCGALAAQGLTVVRSGVYDHALDNVYVNAGGTKIAARLVLARALDAMTAGRVWILNYDPQVGVYHLAIVHLVQKRLIKGGALSSVTVPTAAF